MFEELDREDLEIIVELTRDINKDLQSKIDHLEYLYECRGQMLKNLRAEIARLKVPQSNDSYIIECFKGACNEK